MSASDTHKGFPFSWKDVNFLWEFVRSGYGISWLCIWALHLLDSVGVLRMCSVNTSSHYHSDLNWEFYIIRVGIFLKQKNHYSIYFSLMKIKLKQWAKDLDFTNLITWKRNQIFKWQLKTGTGFSYFPSPTLTVTKTIESDHFFLNYFFQLS